MSKPGIITRLRTAAGRALLGTTVVVRDERSDAYARAMRVARTLGLTPQGFVAMGMMGARGGGDQHTRFSADWIAPNLGPNETNQRTLATNVARTREAVERNPYLKSARDRFRTNVVGRGGIRLEPDTGLPSLDEKIEREWGTFVDNASVDRGESLEDLQGLHCDESFDAGSVLVRFVLAPAFRGVPAGPAIELIPNERVDLNIEGKTREGNIVRQGVEVDDLSRVVAYHVLKDLPNDGGWFNTRTVGTLESPDVERISAENARLSFHRHRAGQLRGGPGAGAALETLRYLDDYSLAVILGATLAASLTPVVEGVPRPKDDTALSKNFFDADGNPISEISMGQVGYTPTGVSVKFPSGQPMTQSLDLVSKVCLYAVGASLGVPYAALTGDYSQTNFAASRAVELEVRKAYREAQKIRYRHLVRPYYAEVVKHGILSGRIVLTPEERRHLAKDGTKLLAHRVVWPGWEWVDPKKQAEANAIELETGTTTLAAVCGEKGEWWQDVIDQRLKEEQYEAMKRAEMKLGPKEPRPGLRIVSGDAEDEDTNQNEQRALAGGRP